MYTPPSFSRVVLTSIYSYKKERDSSNNNYNIMTRLFSIVSHVASPVVFPCPAPRWGCAIPSSALLPLLYPIDVYSVLVNKRDTSRGGVAASLFCAVELMQVVSIDSLLSVLYLSNKITDAMIHPTNKPKKWVY